MSITDVRSHRPLVHCITNYVTVNDCANALLAIGAAPVMADDYAEVADITQLSGALVLNIGTLNARTIRSMLRSGRAARTKGIPVILDPVGAGASALRTRTAQKIIKIVKPSVIRGNLSEIGALLSGNAKTRGVDAAAEDTGSDATRRAEEAGRQLARHTGAIVAITGKTDVVSDGNRIIRIHNGHSLMPTVTGTGCMATAITAAFCSAAQAEGKPLIDAVALALALTGLAGERAALRLPHGGSASFRTAFIDELSLIDDRILEREGRLDTAS